MKAITPAGGMFLALNTNEDLSERLKEFVSDKEAFSPNTWRQLLSVMRSCHTWATRNGKTFFPLSAPDLRDYLDYLHARGLASSTIASHASLISMLHRNAGMIPPNASPSVTRAMKKINRVAVVAGERTGQAIPFRIADLQNIDAAWQNSQKKNDLRNLAFLHVAYSTLLRMSELARIRVRDLSRADDGRFIIDVAYTKTIVQAGGLVKSLSTQSSKRLTEWLDAAGIAGEPDAFVFCRVHRTNKAVVTTDKPLTAPALESIFSAAWLVAGAAVPVTTNKSRYAGWSGHSARVGAAMDMAKMGYGIAEIMQEGTWKKTETLMRYIRNVEVQKGAMIDLMETVIKQEP